MKLNRMLILAALLLGAAPAVSHAGCSPACASGVSCRITSQGPPTVYACASAVRAGRGPAATLATQSGVAQKGSAPSGAAVQTTGPKNVARPKAIEKIEHAAVKSPRDSASGQATGRRQYTP